MNKAWHSSLLQRRMTRKEFLIFGGLAVASVFGLGGVIKMLTSHAATPFLSTEPDNGTVKAPASVVTDSTASGGKAVKFAAAASTPGWKVLKTYELTRDEGWTYTTGVRTIDQSYNRKQQVVFNQSGFTITAERASSTATIYSADMMGRYAPVPNYFAMEADIQLSEDIAANNDLTSGMFPAFWFRPMSGQGELDVWEWIGKNIGTTYEMKSTVIQTGTPYIMSQTTFAIPISMLKGGVTAKHTWRYEKTAGQVALYVDGVYVGAITRAKLDAQGGAGTWNSQFEAGEQWYPRFTFQIGNGSTGNQGGAIPSAWRTSTMHVTRLVSYVPS